MTSARTVARRLSSLSRRRLLLGAGAAAGLGAVAGAGAGIREALGAGKAAAAPVADVPPGPQPAALPARQHAWDAYLAADPLGNPVSPKFDRLLFFDVIGDPSPAYARLLEAALRTLERNYPWQPSRAAVHHGLGSGVWGSSRPCAATRPARTTSRSPTAPFADGTTMHVSYMRLRLGTWYGQLSQQERVARMYAPQVTPEQASEFTTDAESDPNLLGQAITRYGVIGHAQTCARARRNGSPIILRRDFDTTDGGLAGVHFVSLQRTIADFVTTRTAINATSAQLQNPSITDTVNNGINEFIFVLSRGNYVMPARSQRSFPLLSPGA